MTEVIWGGEGRNGEEEGGAATESNSNPQFVITAFELLKEKTLSITTAFAKHTSLSISLTEKLNSSFFSSQTLFRSKTPRSIQRLILKISNVKCKRHVKVITKFPFHLKWIILNYTTIVTKFTLFSSLITNISFCSSKVFNLKISAL